MPHLLRSLLVAALVQLTFSCLNAALTPADKILIDQFTDKIDSLSIDFEVNISAGRDFDDFYRRVNKNVEMLKGEKRALPTVANSPRRWYEQRWWMRWSQMGERIKIERYPTADFAQVDFTAAMKGLLSMEGETTFEDGVYLMGNRANDPGYQHTFPSYTRYLLGLYCQRAKYATFSALTHAPGVDLTLERSETAKVKLIVRVPRSQEGYVDCSSITWDNGMAGAISSGEQWVENNGVALPIHRVLTCMDSVPVAPGFLLPRSLTVVENSGLQVIDSEEDVINNIHDPSKVKTQMYEFLVIKMILIRAKPTTDRTSLKFFLPKGTSVTVPDGERGVPQWAQDHPEETELVTFGPAKK